MTDGLKPRHEPTGKRYWRLAGVSMLRLEGLSEIVAGSEIVAEHVE
jgi:hypothetical protein